MVVNCLPLYEAPPYESQGEGEDGEEEQQGASSTDSPTGPAEKTATGQTESPKRKFTLIKAKSVEALDSVAAELELHDQDYEDYKSDGENFSRKTQAAPRKWSRMSASFSKNLKVMVHNVDDMPPPSGTPEAGMMNGGKKEEFLQGRTEEAKRGGVEGRAVSPDSEAGEMVGEEENVEEEGVQNGESDGDAVARENAGKEGNERTDKKVGGDTVQGGGSGEVEGDKPDAKLGTETSSKDSAEPIAEQPKPKKGKTALREVKSSSPIGNELDNGSDGEDEKTLTVNYLDTNTMSTLKRSSGSVSFYYRTDALQRSTSPGTASIEESVDEVSETAATATAKTTVTVEAKGYYSSANTNPSAPPPSSLATPSTLTTLPDPVLAPSLLPDAPPTLDQEYLERSGWLNKLSHRKGVFGDKWQKRYFVLHRSWLYYFKKYGVS